MYDWIPTSLKYMNEYCSLDLMLVTEYYGDKMQFISQGCDWMIVFHKLWKNIWIQGETDQWKTWESSSHEKIIFHSILTKWRLFCMHHLKSSFQHKFTPEIQQNRDKPYSKLVLMVWLDKNQLVR